MIPTALVKVEQQIFPESTSPPSCLASHVRPQLHICRKAEVLTQGIGQMDVMLTVGRLECPRKSCARLALLQLLRLQEHLAHANPSWTELPRGLTAVLPGHMRDPTVPECRSVLCPQPVASEHTDRSAQLQDTLPSDPKANYTGKPK